MIGLALVMGCALGLTDGDYSQSPISTRPVGGMLFGESFMPPVARLNVLGFDTVSVGGRVADRARKLHLEFASEDDLFPTREVTIMITLDPNRPIAGARILKPNLRLGTDEYRRFYYPRGTQVARGVVGIHLSSKGRPTEMLGDEGSGRIEFGAERGGFIEGRIAMVFPGEMGYLNGRFRAKVTRTKA